MVGNAPGFGEERVDRRPMVVTCFRVGAVVQAGGESKGIRRRDWPVVSCRAEPPLARCDGSQTLGISRPKVSKVIAAAGTAVGQNPTVMRRPGHGGTLRAAPRQAFAALAAGREFADRRLGKAPCR